MTDLKASRDTGTAAKPAAAATPAAGAAGALMALKLPLSVEVGTAELTLREILDLKPGAVLPVGAAETEPIRLYVNGIPVATGDLLTDGDRLTFRVRAITEGGRDADALQAGAPGAKP